MNYRTYLLADTSDDNFSVLDIVSTVFCSVASVETITVSSVPVTPKNII